MTGMVTFLLGVMEDRASCKDIGLAAPQDVCDHLGRTAVGHVEHVHPALALLLSQSTREPSRCTRSPSRPEPVAIAPGHRVRCLRAEATAAAAAAHSCVAQPAA
jgi:hypothetical protein